MRYKPYTNKLNTFECLAFKTFVQSSGAVLFWAQCSTEPRVCFVGDVTYINSGLCLWIRAQKAKPSRNDVVMLVIDTSRYPAHWILHHCWSAFTADMVRLRINTGLVV